MTVRLYITWQRNFGVLKSNPWVISKYTVLQDVPGHPGSGHWQNCILFGKLASYTIVRCSFWLTRSQSHSTASSAPCNSIWWAIMDPDVKSTPTIWTWDLPPKILPVCGPFSYATPNEILLLHPCENFPCLTGRGLVFFCIGHQVEPSEEFDENIDGPLDPFQVPRSYHSAICIKHAHLPFNHHP